MPKFTAHFTVFTTENAHFHFALTTFLTQNAYISAHLAALLSLNVTRPPHTPDKMPKFTAHFTVFTTENAHFHFALTTFLTQNAYISAHLAALLSLNVTRPPHTPDKMPKFTAHFTVFTTENAHFHFALTTFLTQNTYISALLAALYEISVYEMSIYEMSVYEVSDYHSRLRLIGILFNRVNRLIGSLLIGPE